MNWIELALDHASKGYPVFPAREEDKRPRAGFSDWENNATTDPELIRKWWSEGNWLPAITPGRLGLAVIDVDRHPGKPDGFKTLEDENVVLRTEVTGTSLSGNGTHFWHRHDVGSLNGVLTSIDRKAKGGYVVVPYPLPDPTTITEPLPDKLAGSKKTIDVERKYKSVAELNSWLHTVGAGEPDDEMWRVLERYVPSGNQHMSVQVARVVRLAALHHPGATYILDTMQERWLDAPHSSGDPEEEFKVNVRSAIEKFGEPEPDTSLEDQFFDLLNPSFDVSVNLVDLQNSLVAYCQSLTSIWDQIRDEPLTVRALNQCFLGLQNVHSTEDIKGWRTSAKSLMSKVIDYHHGVKRD